VHEHTGIHFDTERLDMMLEKLEPRARARNCQSYLEYYYILKYDDKSEEEWRRVMDVFSVQETYFWREYDQIQALVNFVVPEWFRNSGRPLRIWSAACASGEEPYSLAIALREAGWSDHPIEILASDGSEAALAKAKACLYRERSFRSLPSALRGKYFETRGESFWLRPEISSKVNFRWANLMEIDELLETAKPDVIFCRNVFIYFSPDAIGHVVKSFARHQPAGGHLFIGSSESLLKLTAQFELQEVGGSFVYIRNHVKA
jgi:chemotaxis protein methyltransferase CheR